MKKGIIGILLVALVVVNGIHIWYAIHHSSDSQLSDENLVVISAPEQTEAMKHPYFTVEEYIPVIPDGTNVAAEGKITSDGFVDVYAERNAIDGDSSGGSYWEGSPGLYPNSLKITFEKTRTIHAIRLTLNPDSIWGKRTQTFAVAYTDESGSEQILFPETDYIFDPKTGNELVLEFDAINMTSVSLVFTGNTGANGGQVAEFEIYE